MIDQLDRRLEDWIRSTVEGVEVSLAAPGGGGDEAGPGVGLYLLELIHTPPARTAQQPPLQVTLRYLVTAHAARPEEAHRMLGELVFAALEDAEFEVETEPLSVEVWAALGAAPRPSFVLRVPMRRERQERAAAPRVKVPLVVKDTPLAGFRGQLLGPGGVPVAGARVEMPSANLSTRTDADGRFAFSAVPAAPRAKLLRVRARGREFSVTAAPAGDAGQPLVIHLQGLEE